MRQARTKTENQLMVLTDSSWQEFPDTGRSTVAYIVFYQGGSINHCTHVPGPVYQSSGESDYNAACTTRMDPAHCRIINNKFWKKYTDVVTEQASMILLEGKSSVCMDNNGKDTNHTRNIPRRIQLVRNVEEWNFYKKVCCEEDLQLADI